ncbi:MAG: response regulator transcription factor [Actinobacteria bacterium]|nr:response regulator transcription factor [Actinomycetota bacterium]
MGLSRTGYAPTHALRHQTEPGMRRQIPDTRRPFDEPRLRTVLVANDELLRHGLIHVVSRIEGVHLVGDLRYNPELVGRLRTLRPDLLVFGADQNLTLAQLLLDLKPVPKVVVVMDTADRRATAIDHLRAGADALVDRRSPSTELIRAFQRVMSGQTALDAHTADAVIAELRTPTAGVEVEGLRHLTRREQDVLHLLTEGLDNRTIAARLFVSEATVKFHLHNIMVKFGVHKRAALISAALGGRIVRSR